VLIPLFAVLCDTQLLLHPVAILIVTLMAAYGLAAAGTLVGALTLGLKGRGDLLTLLLLPLVLPVVLAAGDATRLLLADELDFDFWRWLQLLAAFAVTFTTAGIMVCPFVIED
jgi:heme exporter protein B